MPVSHQFATPALCCTNAYTTHTYTHNFSLVHFVWTSCEQSSTHMGLLYLITWSYYWFICCICSYAIESCVYITWKCFRFSVTFLHTNWAVKSSSIIENWFNDWSMCLSLAVNLVLFQNGETNFFKKLFFFFKAKL